MYLDIHILLTSSILAPADANIVASHHGTSSASKDMHAVDGFQEVEQMYLAIHILLTSCI
jgi:hypothetical protein